MTRIPGKRHRPCLAAVMWLLAALSMGTSGYRPVDAQETQDAAASRKIAVLNFTTNNAPDFLSRVVRNVMEVTFFAAGEFQLLEWEHIQKVLKGSGLESRNDPDAADSIRLGEKLKTDYLVVGSIDKIDEYRITTRVISVSEKKILIAYSEKFATAGEIDRVAEKMAMEVNDDIVNYDRTGRLRRRFYDTYRIIIGLQGNYINPVGELHGSINAGYGLLFSVGVRNLFMEDFYLGVGAGYARFSGRENSSDSLTIAPLCLDIGYFVRLHRRFFIQPVISPGLAFIRLAHGTGRGFDMPDNSERSHTEPMVSAGMYLGLSPADRVAVKLGFRYEFIYEPADTVQFLTAGMGIFFSF